jgi:hypothetical protein
MKPPLPIAKFFEAFNLHDADAVVARFASDAVVSDEGRKYRGTKIRTWIDKVNADYQPKAKVISMVRAANKLIVTAQVSGSFPGSPIQLRYHFTLKKGKITALTCGT